MFLQNVGAVSVVTLPAVAQVPTQSETAVADVTLPELTTFVEAEYPLAAAERGIQAEVVLALQIDAQGMVTDAQVVESAGQGFDEAARAAALRFVFRPAQRRGKPVAARILYRYRFQLQPKAPEQLAPVGGALAGRLLIDTGDVPLAGARVQLKGKDGSTTELTSDDQGRFSVDELPVGEYQVRVDAGGFEAYTGSEQIRAGESVEVTYRLTPVIDSEQPVIEVRGSRPVREVTRRTISRRELARVPGTSGDALRALQNLPGVARGPALSGVLVVRGNAQMTTPVLIDGMWIPNVYHFGGLSSVVPTEMLEEIDFYPGNFSVRYGRALAGVVDAHLRQSRDDGRYHGFLQLDLIDARAMIEGPVPFVPGWNFIAAVRRSHVDAWLIPLLEGEDTNIVAAPVYYDYQFIADTRPTSKSYLRLGVLGADDRFKAMSEGSAAGGAIDSVDASWGIGAIYHASLTDRVDVDLTLTMARLHQRFVVSSLSFDTVAFGSIARGELEYRPYADVTLRAGYDVLFAPFSVKGQVPEEGGPNAPQTGSLQTLPPRRFDEDGTFLQPAVYAEMDAKPSRRTQVITGIRADYDHGSQRVDVSPRISARYDLVSGFPRTTLKAGTGLFVQPPGLAEAVLADDETALRSQRNFQNSIGVEQELTEQVDLSVEGFFNLLDDQIGRRIEEDGVLRYSNFGTGRIFGAELMLRYADDERFFGWISYTLSRSERKWSPDPSRLFYLDQTHILTALASYDLGRGWELGGRFRYVSGNLYTPCRAGIFSSISTSYLCVNGPINSRRLPPFHQLDIRVEKTWAFRDFSIGAYLDLINAYNRENPDFISYNYDYTESRPQTGSLPIVPSIGIRGEF